MSERVHISLGVGDLPSAIEFYARLLGHPVSRRREDYANFRLEHPPLHLALVPEPGARRAPGAGHFGIEVANEAELAGWSRRVRAAGLAIREEPDADCCYQRANKLWITDPDGHKWEIWYRLDRESAAVVGPVAESCCSPAR